MIKFYVVQVVNGPEDFEEVNLIGPFDTGTDASDYGATHCSPGGPDDPRWNTVRSYDGGPIFRHRSPGEWVKGAYKSYTDHGKEPPDFK